MDRELQVINQHILQQTVGQWCERHYPGEGIQQKLQNVAEEFAELTVELGGDVDKIIATLRASADRPRTGTRAALEGEAGDLQLSVLDLAHSIDVDALGCLEAKLDSLATRTPEESRARAEKKAGQGISQSF